jgi:acetamidase/formamidase
MEAARAVGAMVDLLSAQRGTSPVDAYPLRGVRGDLHTSEIVELNWTISFYFPHTLFD